MTVKDLRRALVNVPDDAIVTFWSGYEEDRVASGIGLRPRDLCYQWSPAGKREFAKIPKDALTVRLEGREEELD